MSRWFVLGNGPSLNDTPLDKLIGENCVGMNRIHLVYDKTDWRPTIYVKTDHNPYLLNLWAKETMLQINLGIKCYLWEQFRDGFPKTHPNYESLPVGIGDFPNVTWIPRCKHHGVPSYSSGNRAFKWHLPEICSAYSGIGPAMQVAVLNGATEIYLLGCDLGYGREKGLDHFSTEYSLDNRKLGEFDINEVTEAHMLAKNSIDIPVYNATVGGDLEVWKRKDIWEVLNQPTLEAVP